MKVGGGGGEDQENRGREATGAVCVLYRKTTCTGSCTREPQESACVQSALGFERRVASTKKAYERVKNAVRVPGERAHL